jgi:adenylate kinase family enzyme
VGGEALKRSTLRPSQFRQNGVVSPCTPVPRGGSAAAEYIQVVFYVMKPSIILIGPLGVGKSTIGHLLAEKLGLSQCSVDLVRWEYYNEIGFDNAFASKIAKSDQGVRGVLRYSEPFDAHAIERVLAKHGDGVIDFGASNSVYEDKVLFARVENILAPYPNVILLLPSSDLDESVEILNTRLTRMLEARGEEITNELFDLNEYFTKHPSSHRLAKLVIYTKDKTPEEICNEILERLV